MCLWLLTLSPEKGGWYSLESHKESLEWAALRRIMGEWLWYFQGPIYLGSKTAIFFEES